MVCLAAGREAMPRPLEYVPLYARALALLKVLLSDPDRELLPADRTQLRALHVCLQAKVL
jgi:hypothetical protein